MIEIARSAHVEQVSILGRQNPTMNVHESVKIRQALMENPTSSRITSREPRPRPSRQERERTGGVTGQLDASFGVL